MLLDPVRDGQSAAEVARGVCQHIIGLNPTAIRYCTCTGTCTVTRTFTLCYSDEEDKENSLLHQSYLLDEEFKVLLYPASLYLLTSWIP